jgi:deoxyribose-phosphate aldolase
LTKELSLTISDLSLKRKASRERGNVKMRISFDDFCKRIELSMVSHLLTSDDIKFKCKEGIKSNIGVICVNPTYVPIAKKIIGNSGTDLSVNVGFPFGTHLIDVKVMETKQGINNGANQIDMVINVGALRSGNYKLVSDEIKAVVGAASGRKVKVIIEAWVLNRDEKIRACKIVEDAGADLVKTSTGVKTQYIKEFCNCEDPIGANLEDIILFRKVLSPKIKIKASGGVYSLDDAFKMLKAGADQLGVSKGMELISDFRKKYGEKTEIQI